MLRLTISQSVSLGVEPRLERIVRFYVTGLTITVYARRVAPSEVGGSVICQSLYLPQFYSTYKLT
jgi:hypothetical protein